jgi:hypothetical protein
LRQTSTLQSVHKHRRQLHHTSLTLQLLCSSGKLRPGRYLRNADSMQWVHEAAISLCKNIYHIRCNDSASSKSSSSQRIWDWYFSLTFSATKQVPASHRVLPFYLSFTNFLSLVSVYYNWTLLGFQIDSALECIHEHNTVYHIMMQHVNS